MLRTMRFRALLLAGFLLCTLRGLAAPVVVRFPEGSVHGFLALRSLDGKLLAAGDLTQTVHGAELTSRLVYRFKDGSLDDETAVFTQAGHFHLLHDHLVQKGPSFPKPVDVTIDVRSGEVTVRSTEDGKPKVETSHMDLPDDLANGILLVLVKNITPMDPETKISYLAATPKPRLVHLTLDANGTEEFRSAGFRNKAQRYRVHIELGGMAGVIAPVIGKAPADSTVWVSQGEVPAFMKSESPLFLGGPQLRTELIGPVWQGTRAPAHP